MERGQRFNFWPSVRLGLNDSSHSGGHLPADKCPLPVQVSAADTVNHTVKVE
jgi:hypothetical protein